MKTQILIIGGGNVFEKHEEYITYIEKRQISWDSFRPGKNWKNNLNVILGEDYDVLIPQMPNNWNARFCEWKIWLERIAPLLEDDVILIGHSLGGIFLAKYLSEKKFPRTIKATFFLAAPFVTSKDRPLADFLINPELKGVEEQAGRIFVYHSKDDAIVPVVCADRYASALPSATLRMFENYGHLNLPEFPEIVEDIRSL